MIDETNDNLPPIMPDLSEDEQNAFLEEVGTLIFKSTVMRYLSVLSPEQAQVFETFVKVHSESDNFIEELSKQYPEFKILLDEEMEAFNNELGENNTQKL